MSLNRTNPFSLLNISEPIERTQQVAKSNLSVTSLLNLEKLDSLIHLYHHALLSRHTKSLVVDRHSSAKKDFLICELIKQLYANIELPQVDFDHLCEQINRIHLSSPNRSTAAITCAGKIHNESNVVNKVMAVLTAKITETCQGNPEDNRDEILAINTKMADIRRAMDLVNNVVELEKYKASLHPITETYSRALIKKASDLYVKLTKLNEYYHVTDKGDLIDQTFSGLIRDTETLSLDYKYVYDLNASINDLQKNLSPYVQGTLEEPEDRKKAVDFLLNLLKNAEKNPIEEWLPALINFAKIDQLIAYHQEIVVDEENRQSRQKYLDKKLRPKIGEFYRNIKMPCNDFNQNFLDFEHRVSQFNSAEIKLREYYNHPAYIEICKLESDVKEQQALIDRYKRFVNNAFYDCYLEDKRQRSTINHFTYFKDGWSKFSTFLKLNTVITQCLAVPALRNEVIETCKLIEESDDSKMQHVTAWLITKLKPADVNTAELDALLAAYPAVLAEPSGCPFRRNTCVY